MPLLTWPGAAAHGLIPFASPLPSLVIAKLSGVTPTFSFGSGTKGFHYLLLFLQLYLQVFFFIYYSIS